DRWKRAIRARASFRKRRTSTGTRADPGPSARRTRGMANLPFISAARPPSGTSTSLRSSISGLGRGRHLEQRRVAGAGAAAQRALATAFGRCRGLLGRLLAGDGLVLGLLLVAPAEALAAQPDLAVGGISRRRCLAGCRCGRRVLRNCSPAENARRPIRPVDHATAPG